MIRNKNAPATPTINSVLVPVVLAVGVTAAACADVEVPLTIPFMPVATGTNPFKKPEMLDNVEEVAEGMAVAPVVFGARFATEDIAGVVGLRNPKRSVVFI